MDMVYNITLWLIIYSIYFIYNLTSNLNKMSGETINLSNNIRSLKHLFTKIRDRATNNEDFRTYSKRIMHLICEEGISLLEPKRIIITTPTNSDYTGEIIDENNIIVVSIIRAGDSMLGSFMELMPKAAVGKILIQRDEATAKPILFYSKLPNLKDKRVVLVDPMLATGGSALCAIEVLKEKGVDTSKLYFLNVVSAPEGIKAIHASFPG